MLKLIRAGRDPIEVPPPLILIDQREQLPYTFQNHRRINGTQTILLETGDYGLAEFPDLIRIERKTAKDLYVSLSHGTGNRQRFLACCERLTAYPDRSILVEATLADLSRPQPYTDYHPNALLGSLTAILTRHRIPIIFAGTRDLAEDWAANTLAMAYAYAYAEARGLDRILIEGDL